MSVADGEQQTCEHPDCEDRATKTYTDRVGNELALCVDHYAGAVLPTVTNRAISITDRPDGERQGFGGLFR